MKTATRSFYARGVQQAVERIATSLDDALDLQALAAGASLSPFHFHRVFKGMLGETPLELMRRLRMERAAWRLIESSSTPVTEIAFEAGFETHEAFTRAFRACFSTTPSGFRQRQYPRIELAATCGVHFNPDGRVPEFIARDSGGRQMDVDITERPELRVGTIRHIGPYNQIPVAFQRLGMVAGRGGLLGHPAATMLAVYYDDPETTPQEELRSDAGVVIAENARLPEGLVEQRIPGGKYARTVHVGPYEQLGDAWARLMGEWLPASGYRIGPGVTYEVYLNDPSRVAKEELRTELYVPIA
jgi:AraC family transcriptional regulator